jgi:hypothetical protein
MAASTFIVLMRAYEVGKADVLIFFVEIKGQPFMEEGERVCVQRDMTVSLKTWETSDTFPNFHWPQFPSSKWKRK